MWISEQYCFDVHDAFLDAALASTRPYVNWYFDVAALNDLMNAYINK